MTTYAHPNGKPRPWNLDDIGLKMTQLHETLQTTNSVLVDLSKTVANMSDILERKLTDIDNKATNIECELKMQFENCELKMQFENVKECIVRKLSGIENQLESVIETLEDS